MTRQRITPGHIRCFAKPPSNGSGLESQLCLRQGHLGPGSGWPLSQGHMASWRLNGEEKPGHLTQWAASSGQFCAVSWLRTPQNPRQASESNPGSDLIPSGALKAARPLPLTLSSGHPKEPQWLPILSRGSQRLDLNTLFLRGPAQLDWTPWVGQGQRPIRASGTDRLSGRVTNYPGTGTAKIGIGQSCAK